MRQHAGFSRCIVVKSEVEYGCKMTRMLTL